MFENLVSNIKNQTSKVSENVLTSIKSRSSQVSSLLSARNQENTKMGKYTVGGNDQIPLDNEYYNRKRLLKWPVLVDNRMRWISLQTSKIAATPKAEDENDDDIVEKFLKVITPEENDPEDRRNDREEIRRRLAMGPDADDYYGPSGERQGGRKPSLQSRLQSGMNLQICFMNETVSDGESPTGSECESASSSPTSPSTILSSSLPSCLPSSPRTQCHVPSSARESALEAGVGGTHNTPFCVGETGKPSPPRSLSLKSTLMSRGGAHSLPSQHPPGIVGGVVGRWDILGSGGRPDQHSLKWDGEDFFGRQARLQAEARVALAQAKEMAHMQMEVERQRQKVNSPITQMVRASLLKVGLVFPADRRRVSRQMLTEMNVAQLQVIVNDLHTQIEVLNEDLVKLLMERDDLHMEQDSMLVDIEDLTRYLGAKEKALKESGRASACSRNSSSNSEGGSRGVGGGSLPSLPLIFRQAGVIPKAGQVSRPRIAGLLSKK